MSELEHVRARAELLIAAHLEPDWTFAFDGATRRAGLCDFERRRISVSRYLAARSDDEANEQTLLHEIAHALAGPGAGHGTRWRRVAVDLGYRGGTTYPGEAATELAPWIGLCPAGHVVYRYRRPARAMSCSLCASRFDERHAFRWTRREITRAARLAAMTPGDAHGGCDTEP